MMQSEVLCTRVKVMQIRATYASEGGMSRTRPLAFVDWDGPNEFVNNFLKSLMTRFHLRMSRAHQDYLVGLEALKEEARQQEQCVDLNSVHCVWGGFLEDVDKVFMEFFQTLVDIGSSAEYAKYAVPDPATWAYGYLAFFYSQIEEHAQRKIIPTLASLLEPTETRESLHRQFEGAIEGHLGELADEAVLELARKGWRPSAGVLATGQAEIPPTEAVEQPTLGTTQSSGSDRFSLADLDEPGIFSTRLIVHELYPCLRDTLKEARSWVNQEGLKKHEVSYKDIAERFPLLKDAKLEEMQDIVNVGNSPSKVALGMMTVRTGLPEDTINSYRWKKNSSKHSGPDKDNTDSQQ
jgi:hypothetical protein